jgi:hypothetical protein
VCRHSHLSAAGHTCVAVASKLFLPSYHLLLCVFLLVCRQGLSLHLIGNVGAGSAKTNCSVKAVSVAIYNSDGNNDPTTVAYNKIINFTNADSTFKWDSNSSGVLYMDVAPAPDQFLILQNSTNYWLRVKVFADYGGASSSGQ